jgi:hypothetical protein
VTRIVDIPPEPDAAGGPPYWSQAPSLDPGAELIDGGSEKTGHYAVRPVRPVAQLAARIGLWGAVGLGCLGGLFGLVRPSPAAEVPAAVQATDASVVPAPVTGVAERVVATWLTATDGDQEQLNELFVDGVSLDGADTSGLTVGDVTAVAGRRIQDGYWTVTVAAEVSEPVPTPVGGAEAASDESAVRASTWYVEVGIVGEVDGGLAALTTPAVVPAPPADADGWQRSDKGAQTPDDDDPVVVTIQGFLTALLTGEGDPARYLAPGGSIVAADPPPFTEVLILQMAAVPSDDETEVRAWTQVRVTTPGGSRHVVAYEVVVARGADRWEVVELSGVPTVVEAPSDPEPVPSEPGRGSSDTDVTPTEPSATESTTSVPTTRGPTDGETLDGTTAD